MITALAVCCHLAMPAFADEPEEQVLQATEMTQIEFLGLARVYGMSGQEVRSRLPNPLTQNPFDRQRINDRQIDEVGAFYNELRDVPAGTQLVLEIDSHIVFDTYDADTQRYYFCLLSSVLINETGPDTERARDFRRSAAVIPTFLRFVRYSQLGGCRANHRPEFSNPQNHGFKIGWSLPFSDAEKFYNAIGGNGVYHPATYRCTGLTLFKPRFNDFSEIRCSNLTVSTRVLGELLVFEVSSVGDEITHFDWRFSP